MKKLILAAAVCMTAGLSVAAVESGRSRSALASGTVLNPFTLQVVSANTLSSTSESDPVSSGVRVRNTPTDEVEIVPVPVRPGPFTPPPRSPYAPPPR